MGNLLYVTHIRAIRENMQRVAMIMIVLHVKNVSVSVIGDSTLGKMFD
ncbi:MAG: hypothetical protein ACW97Z_04820 [Candidatus Hodarchaeales archaeon]